MIIHVSREISGFDDECIKEWIRMSMNDLQEIVGHRMDWLGINHFAHEDGSPHTHLIICGYSLNSQMRMDLNSYHFLQLEKSLHSHFSSSLYERL
ncbi:hypothetical protein ACI2JA_11025 [Alkalihalobacillus sp. NPDC078783]